MAQHMLTPPEMGHVDKRKSVAGKSVADPNSHAGAGRLGGSAKGVFTANAGGSTTTIVGADATLGTATNVVRVGEKVVVASSTGANKSDDVKTVTGVASAAGTTTVTFTPALPSATVSGDQLVLVSSDPFTDNDSIDKRLLAIGGYYTQKVVDAMNQNDKIYALRVLDDPGSI